MVAWLRELLADWRSLDPSRRLALDFLAFAVLMQRGGIVIQLLLPLELLRWFGLVY